MVIEIKKGIKINGEQLFIIIVDGETIYSNLNYEELCNITIGDLDNN